MTPLEFAERNRMAWDELEEQLSRKPREIDAERFLYLYRACCEHFALAQARSFPPFVIDRLSQLTARAHKIVYRQTTYRWTRIVRTLTRDFPLAVRASRAEVAIAALLLLAPTLLVGVLTYLHPTLILSIVDPRMVARFEEMYRPSAQLIGAMHDSDSNWAMFGFYIMNNIGIAFQSYATGVLFGAGTVFFLAYNGVFGGSVAGYLTHLGLGGTFYPFVSTHSAFELTAFVLAGAGGLRLGRAMLLPGRLPRWLALQTAARETGVIVFGAAVMLLIAAFVEGFWSSAPWVAPIAKYCAAAFCWFLVALFFLKRRA